MIPYIFITTAYGCILNGISIVGSAINNNLEVSAGNPQVFRTNVDYLITVPKQNPPIKFRFTDLLCQLCVIT